MKYDVIVAGAGLAGITAANVLADNGYKILVVEKNAHIGGQCFDFTDEHGISVHKYGPHIFHTSRQDVWEYICRFTTLNSYVHEVLSCIDGLYYNFPINRTTINDVFGTSLKEEEIEAFLNREVERAVFDTPARSFRDAMVSQLGETLYSRFIEHYTRKQWGREPSELEPELAGRIVIRKDDNTCFFSDSYQGIPGGGYTEMCKKMLDHDNITVLLDSDYFKVKDEYACGLTVYTGELDRFFDYKYGKLEYRSIRLDFRSLEQESFLPAAVVNYPGEVPYTRITEFKKFTSQKSPHTTVCYEYPDAGGMPFYVVPTSRNKNLKDQYIADVRKLEDSHKFIFVGRLAEYKYYNMDDVIAMSINRANQWLEGIKD